MAGKAAVSVVIVIVSALQRPVSHSATPKTSHGYNLPLRHDDKVSPSKVSNNAKSATESTRCTKFS